MQILSKIAFVTLIGITSFQTVFAGPQEDMHILNTLNGILQRRYLVSDAIAKLNSGIKLSPTVPSQKIIEAAAESSDSKIRAAYLGLFEHIEREIRNIAILHAG